MVITDRAHSIEILNNKIHDGSWGGDNLHAAKCIATPIPFIIAARTLFLKAMSCIISHHGGFMYMADRPTTTSFAIIQFMILVGVISRSSGILIYAGNGNQVYDNLIYNGSQGIEIGPGATNTQIHNNNVYNMLQ